jgi:glucose-1-phosphate thymidylyltransferase
LEGSLLDVIVLAGGYAQRLWPLTEHYPKALLGLAGRAVLHHAVSNVATIPDIANIVVAIDGDRIDLFRPSLDTLGRDTGVHLRVSAHKKREQGGIKSAVEKIGEILDSDKDLRLSSDRLLIVGADNVFGVRLSRFVQFQREKGTAAIAIHRRTTAIDASDFGVPTLNQAGRLVAFDEKPVAKRGYSLISTACYLLPRVDANLVHEYLRDSSQESLGSFIRWLRTRTTIDGFQFDEDWFDIGTRAGILAANRFLLSSDTRNQRAPSVVSGSTGVNDPVFIADGVLVQDSVIGPNVYCEPRCSIVRSSIENSIVYEGSQIIDCDLRDSIVGPGSIVEGRVSEAVFGPKSMTVTGR